MCIFGGGDITAFVPILFPAIVIHASRHPIRLYYQRSDQGYRSSSSSSNSITLHG